MEWLPFIVLVGVTIVHSVIAKLVINHLPKFKALGLLFLSSTLIAIGIWLVYGELFPLEEFLWNAGLLGFLNWIGAQSEWSANKISLSKTKIFAPLISLFATILFCIAFQEYKYLNTLAIGGFALHLVALWLFRIGQKKQEEDTSDYHAWIISVAGWLTANILIAFYLKSLANHETPATQFIVCWYPGSFVYFSLTFLFTKDKPLQEHKPKLFFLIPVVSLLTISNLLCHY